MKYDAGLIGKRIRSQRKRLGLTQEALAEILDISPAYLGQIENGRRGVNLENLIELSKALGVTLDYLAGDYLENQLSQEKMREEQWLRLLEGLSPQEADTLIQLVKTMRPILFSGRE